MGLVAKMVFFNCDTHRLYWEQFMTFGCLMMESAPPTALLISCLGLEICMQIAPERF